MPRKVTSGPGYGEVGAGVDVGRRVLVGVPVLVGVRVGVGVRDGESVGVVLGEFVGVRVGVHAGVLVGVRVGAGASDGGSVGVMGTHFCYSSFILGLPGAVVASPRVLTVTTWCDVFFGAAIAVVTEGGTSPFFTFFAFAVMEAGLTAGFRRALTVTTVSVGLYLSLILVSAPGNANIYMTRTIFICITGYLLGFFGQQRLNLEAGIRELAGAAARQQIARDLHDGSAQALAGIGLQLKTCQELLRLGRHTEALLELSDLHGSVNREYDDLRTYMRSLVGVEITPARRGVGARTQFSVRVQFDGSGTLLDQVLQILREGASNVIRHARATSAAVYVGRTGGMLRINIDDDGVGFGDPIQQPWSIMSRVTELGGAMRLAQGELPGAHLVITLPVQ